MLWDLIRDFIVTHITGGHTSESVTYSGLVGWANNSIGEVYTDDIYAPIDGYLFEGYTPFTAMSLGDWLATTLTIISLVFILVACVMFVVKIIKLVGNLVK